MTIQEIARALVAPGRGILAADESTGTIQKRFDSIKVECSEENRRAYRELLFTAPDVEKYISGVILYDETIRQRARDGHTFVTVLEKKGILPGIKVDMGTESFNGSDIEKYTKGLEGLEQRLTEYSNFGAQFAKWRAVFSISDVLPSTELIAKNATDLAEYAFLCQQHGIVPIVEPEVLMDGGHTIEQCFEVTRQVLKKVFEELSIRGVALNGILLKPNMIIPGKAWGIAKPMEVAQKTISCFEEVIPHEVPGIVFLSGGQSEQEACENLHAINSFGQVLPWQLSFSYGRALQSSALKAWSGKTEQVDVAQAVFVHRAKLVSAARSGNYSSSMELAIAENI